MARSKYHLKTKRGGRKRKFVYIKKKNQAVKELFRAEA